MGFAAGMLQIPNGVLKKKELLRMGRGDFPVPSLAIQPAS